MRTEYGAAMEIRGPFRRGRRFRPNTGLLRRQTRRRCFDQQLSTQNILICSMPCPHLRCTQRKRREWGWESPPDTVGQGGEGWGEQFLPR